MARRKRRKGNRNRKKNDAAADPSVAKESLGTPQMENSAVTVPSKKENLKTESGTTAVRARWIKVAIAIVCITLPVASYFGWYYFSYMLPFGKSLHFSTSQLGGRHHEISTNLIAAMKRSEKFNNATVERESFRGSLENLRRMQFGEIDFALYQAGTQYILSDEEFWNLDNYKDKKNGTMPGDGSDSLDLTEFTRQRNPTEPDRERKAAAAFQLLDTDKDGLLSSQEFNDTSSIKCVAVLYPEVVHLIVKDDLKNPITTPAQLRGKCVALGEKWSGTYAMSMVLLEHFGMDDNDIERFSSDVIDDDDPDGKGNRELSYYDRVKAGFESGELDAAIITIGYHSKFVEELFTDHKTYGVKLLPILSAKGLMTKHVVLKDYEIPAETYHNQLDAIPTVGVNAMLLAHANVDDVVVSEVTRLVMDEQFLKQNKLGRLYRQSPQQRYLGAQDSPEFEIHAGAKDFYDPDIDVGQFERWDALRSIIASTLIACVIIGRWLVERHRRQTQHRVVQYMHSLFEIEQRQLTLDRVADADDVQELQDLLDKITLLRQRAFDQFSAHDLKTHGSLHTFLEMCHYISNKISAKISRQRHDQRFAKLSQALDRSQARV